ncbi:MAG: hypothetical protein WD069_14220, partial [Planctomycetales bacterium]
EKKVPPDVSIFWTFDEKNVAATVANGDAASKRQYTTLVDGEHRVIRIDYDAEMEPDRVGWYEFKDGKLRIQLTQGTGKPPTEWDEDQVMVFVPAPRK